MLSRTHLVISLLLTLPLTGLALATTMREMPKTPPAEAFTACADKKAGDAVTVALPDGRTVQAVCQTLNGQLAARPVMAPPAKPENRHE